MDIDEWEILPDDGFLEIHDDGGKKIFSRKYGKTHQNSVFQMNYFMCPCPSPNSPKLLENSIVPKQIVHVPIQLDHDQGVKERIKVPIEIKIARSSSPVIAEKIEDPNILAVEAASDQDAVSQVFFKKMKENEFVDMKMDSPKSCSRGTTTMVPQNIDATNNTFKFDDKSEGVENLDSDIKEEEVTWEENSISSGGLNLWKWSLNGVGAICSFGVAAATICIIILGSNHRNKQNQKLRFQIYTDDKRIKQMAHHGTKLNEAISAARGVSLTRAHITSGGYYDGL